MNEYEYSFMVESIKPFIDYCKENNYEKVSETVQNRIVYENKISNNLIARITKNINDGKEVKQFDFKNTSSKKDRLNDSLETIPLEVTDDNEKAIYSILQVLEFYEVANNYRTRYVYKKDGVKFEIDDYTSPNMQVIGIEGNKEEVDKVYNEIINNNVGVIINS